MKRSFESSGNQINQIADSQINNDVENAYKTKKESYLDEDKYKSKPGNNIIANILTEEKNDNTLSSLEFS